MLAPRWGEEKKERQETRWLKLPLLYSKFGRHMSSDAGAVFHELSSMLTENVSFVAVSTDMEASHASLLRRNSRITEISFLSSIFNK